ncbi:MAG: DNA-directed RNA polymerase subunit beta, partial [Armatimonadetes bacterium]|nr:DNA-directed RNA polymerase subunit beta [Armatimonadota bacterium]
IARILPDCDMPYMPDGTPVDIVLNPLGVPSRMNIGQILETHLGLVGRTLGTAFPNPVFRSASEDEIRTGMREVESLWRVHALARLVGGELTLCDEQEFEGLSWEEASDRVRTVLTRLPAAEAAELAEEIALPAETLAAAAGETALVEPLLECLLRRAVLRAGFDAETGKCVVRDGRTGEAFNQPVVVGEVYMMKLNHLVDDKIHARSTGPYSLVTQQPLGGKAQFGGQRFGEMEVWALEAYGAAHLLQEMLTIKSDDMVGRVKAYEAIVKGERISGSGVPESFKILIKELQSLGLQITVESEDGEAMELRDADEDTPDTDVRM